MWYSFDKTNKSNFNSTRVEMSLVAIIGAGAAGLITSYILQLHHIPHIVFESRSSLGGVWRYDGSDSTKPMYSNLRTNLPTQVMGYWEGLEISNSSESFPSHREILAYLESISETYALQQHIKFSSEVIDISKDGNSNQWIVTYNQQENDGAVEHKEVFDGVVVCNCHFNKPNMPSITGMEYFKGDVIHSIEYDNPDVYADKTVLVVGIKASGTDISYEISKTAKLVYTSNRLLTASAATEIDNILMKPSIHEIREDGLVYFTDDTSIAVDAIVLCTGYHYDYPFLQNVRDIIDVRDGRAVFPLYQYFFSINDPSLAFIGLSYNVVPFPMFYLQAQWYANVFSDKIALPSKEEMNAWYEEHGVTDTSYYTYHNMETTQFDYLKFIAQQIGFYNDRSDKYIDMIRAIRTNVAQYRPRHPGGEPLYRERQYRLDRESLTWEVHPKSKQCQL